LTFLARVDGQSCYGLGRVHAEDPAMAVIVKKLPDPWLALGLAAHFIGGREPFSRFPAGDLIRTLNGQVRRGHYLFALDTAAEPARVVGYLGWALYDSAVADRFVATGVPPADEPAMEGDVAWILTAAALNRAAFFAMTKAARKLYPDHRVIAIRHKAGGRRVRFDQSRARVKAKRSGATAG
jgi:hemolysin-activating ACP:hemolysin acyltransferase